MHSFWLLWDKAVNGTQFCHDRWVEMQAICDKKIYDCQLSNKKSHNLLKFLAM